MGTDDDGFEKLQRKIEQELTNHYRMRLIVSITLQYFDMSRRRVLSKSLIPQLVYIRFMMVYVASNIYGINAGIISKYLKFNERNVYQILHVMKEKMRSDVRMHSDLENIRQRLIKVLGK